MKALSANSFFFKAFPGAAENRFQAWQKGADRIGGWRHSVLGTFLVVHIKSVLAPMTVTSSLPVPFEGERKNVGVYCSLGAEPVPKQSGTSVTVPRVWQDMETACKTALHCETLLSARQCPRRTDMG